jgi:hypothetical protein
MQKPETPTVQEEKTELPQPTGTTRPDFHSDGWWQVRLYTYIGEVQELSF